MPGRTVRPMRSMCCCRLPRGCRPNHSASCCGDGHENRPATTGAAPGLQHVAFFDPVPKAQIPLVPGANRHRLHGWQRVPIYRFGIAPNKLMDYMMARCVVLHSVEAARPRG